jgi:putative addiction module component (TIGR02574 family)
LTGVEPKGGDNLDAKTVEYEALRLSPEDRAQLAHKLLLSLDTLSEEELADTWLTEADRRARELDRGEVQPIPADEVRRKARVLLR